MQAGIPFFTLDRGIEDKPDGETYITSYTFDFYLDGVSNGLSIVEKLTEKYGEPKGTLAEIAGVMGSDASRMRSQAIRRVLADYPDIKVVTVRPGDFDRDASFKAAQDILTVNPKGTLDGIIASCDTSAIAALEAIRIAGRDELIGYVWGVDGLVEALEAILKGDMVQTHECAPYLGMVVFEYAIHYLNGEDVPKIIPIPQRNYMADTEEKKEAIQKIVDECKSRGSLFVPSDLGYYDLFVVPQEGRSKYLPNPSWEMPKEYIEEFEPYTETN